MIETARVIFYMAAIGVFSLFIGCCVPCCKPATASPSGAFLSR